MFIHSLFLAIEQTGRISLAGFSDVQCVVFITFCMNNTLRDIALILPSKVLYDMIWYESNKCCTDFSGAFIKK